MRGVKKCGLPNVEAWRCSGPGHQAASTVTAAQNASSAASGSPPFGRASSAAVIAPIETPEIVEYLRERLADGRFRPVVDRDFPLTQIVEPYRYVETGQKVGNVVITVR